uniref:Melanocortin-2 receptor accessory protein n=1 Tax=Nothoprocta perdicaria TaxID=30464 RepID=A0A8C6ZHD7_NOTPE
MANRTNASEYFWSYEYYWDYIDPIPVDGRKLKVNKYTIVIAFWVGLAAFVMFLFLILLYMSRSGSTPIKVINKWNDLKLYIKLVMTKSLLLNASTSISPLLGKTVEHPPGQKCGAHGVFGQLVPT